MLCQIEAKIVQSEYLSLRQSGPMTRHESQNPLSSQLTFASFYALSPGVIKICVAYISAFLEPSTTASTTATFARITGTTALRARETSSC